MKSLFRFLISTLAASTLFVSRVGAQVVDYGSANGIYSFEKDAQPALASKGSAVSISDEHAKLGRHALKWEWKKKGSALTMEADVPYLPENPDPKETSVSSFVFWVYAPESIQGSLRFAFLKDGKECCHFTYGLGFKGWRGAWVAFDRDMQGTPEVGMDEIRITAPEGVKNGCLYFDGVIPASFQDVRHHTPDWQAPFINEKTTNHWLVLGNSWKLRLDVPQKESLTPDDIQDLDSIRTRFVRIVTEKAKPYSLKKAREIYDSYGIRYNEDGTITGKPIYFIRYGETFLNLGIPDAKQSFRRSGQLLRTLNDHLLRIAVSAVRAEDPKKKAEFTKIYLDLTRHLLDQGFAAGSGQGTLHHLGYSMRNFYTAPVIMQEALREAGLDGQVQQAMEWFSGVGEIKVAPKEPGMDIDAFNTSLMGRMASVLMLDDTPYKYAYMQALSRWIDNGMKHTEGLRPCFKRDGSVVHHRKSYPAYATGGFTGAVNAVWMLSRTGFAISQESHQNLKDALLAMAFYCYGDKFPLAMSGRHPDGKGGLIPEHYYRLAVAGSPDGKAAIDTLLAGAYRYLLVPGVSRRHNCIIHEYFETPNKNEWNLICNGLYKKIGPGNGTRTFGFNCSMSHRFAGNLVTFAGHSRYLWAAEIYNQANHYGRYLTHGSMQISGPADPEEASIFSSFSQDGWDWCHIPGTTAAVLPMERMKANVLNVDEFSGYEEMLLSDEWFAGGVTHKGISGTFAMKLHEHDKYNGSLRARKSFFAFENRIICLGSDIENSLEDAHVHTTLFQNQYDPRVCRFWHGVDKDTCNILDNGRIIRDRNLCVYFIKDAKVNYTNGTQYSLHEETDARTKGEFQLAYIDHGDVLKNGKYEYMVLLPTTESLSLAYDSWGKEELTKYSENLPYTVLRHDSAVHGVEDHLSGTRAFAVFEEGAVDSLIVSSSPALVMYSLEDEQMTLSAANPDLALYEGPSDEKFDADGKRIERSVYGREWIDNPCGETGISITLDGLWELADGKGCQVRVSRDNRQTTLVFKSKEARTEEIILKRVAL